MSDKALTPKQEKFCQKYIELGNASEAYRASFNTSKMKPATVNREAHRLMENPKIATRITELQKKHEERHNVTVDSITRELEEARALAIKVEQPTAMVSASMGKAKLHGYLVEKAEITGKDGGAIEVKDANPQESARRIAFILAQALHAKKSQK